MSKKNKANDKGIPKDELLLAKSIAAAKGLGLTACSGSPFVTANIDGKRYPVQCCAIGAIALTESPKAWRHKDTYKAGRRVLKQYGWNDDPVWTGNDGYASEGWDYDAVNDGEDFGRAFREAMS